MSAKKIVRNLMTRAFRTRTTAPIRKSPGVFARGIEQLEDRVTPTLYVDSPIGFVITTDQGAPDLDNGDTVTWNPGGISHPAGEVVGLTFGTNAFGTIAGGVAAAAPGEIVNVAAGTYAETVTASNPVSLVGPNSGISPNGGMRVAEAVITTGGFLVANGSAGSFSVTGFEFNGAAAGPISTNNNVNANATTLNFEKNRVIASSQIAGFAATNNGTVDVTVTDNFFMSGISNAMQFAGSTNGTVTVDIQDNVIVFANNAGINTDSLSGAIISGNNISNTNQQGIQLAGTNTGTLTVSNNIINNVNASSVADRGGIRFSGAANVSTLDITNNSITGSVNGLVWSGAVTGTITFTGNTLSGQTGAYIKTGVSGNVDATGGNTFDGVNSNSASLTQLFAIEDKILHCLDNATTTSLVRVVANNIYVTQTSGSIQRGVNAAASGDTVNVETGTYPENVTVNKNLALNSVTNATISPLSGNALTISAGTTAVYGTFTTTTFPTVVQSGVTLEGTGTITGPVTIDAGGFLEPGTSPGIFNTGDYTQAGTLNIEIVRPATTPVAGTDYDQVNVTGTVNLTGSLNLIFSGVGTIADGKQFIIINNDGIDPVLPTVFSNYPTNGQTFMADGRQWIIFYNGGDGNDVTLTTVPLATPTTVYVSPTWSLLANGTPIADADFGTNLNQAGVLGYDAFTTIAAAQAAVAAGGTIIVNAGTYAETINLSGTTTLEITGPDTPQTVTISSLSSAATTPVVIEGSSSLTVGDATATTLAGVVSGSGSFIKQGAGTVTLTGANTYTGTTTITGGTLTALGGSAIPDGSAVTVTSPGILNLANSETIGSLAGTGNVTLNANTLTTGGDNTNTTHSGVISGSGGLTKQGLGTITLGGISTFAGNVLISSGMVIAGNSSTVAGVLGAFNAAPTKVVVQAGATLDINGQAAGGGMDFHYGITIAGTGTSGQGALVNNGANGGTNQRQTPNITLSADATIGGTGNIIMINGGYAADTLDLAGFTLTKIGSNTFFLLNTTVTPGTIQIDAGTVSQTNVASNLSNANIVLANTAGATLALGGFNMTIASLAGGGAAGGNVALGGNTLTVNQSSNTTYNGAIGGGGSLIKSGTGTLSLGGTNTYGGTTTVNDGTLTASGGSAIPDGSAVTVTSPGILDLANSETIGSLAGTGNVTLNANTLTTGGNNSSTTYSGVMSGVGGSLVKQGGGTFTLSNTNSYDGTTTVANGTLSLGTGGSIANSATTVQSGATLRGTGTTGPLTIDAGGFHKPGNSPGITTVVGNYNENGDLEIEFASDAGVPGVDFDQTQVTGGGAVTLGGTSTLTVPAYLGIPGTFNPAPAQVFVIIDNDGTGPGDHTGTFSNAPAGTTITVDGVPLTVYYFAGDGNDVVLVSANGTPSTLYVDDGFTTPNVMVDGNKELAGLQPAYVGIDAFASVADALTAYPSFIGTIVLNGGTYATADLSSGAVGNVALQLARDGATDVTIQSLTGDAGDTIVTQAFGTANLIVEAGTFDGVISGGGSVTKSGAGTLTLTAGNTYTGATILNGGTLAVTSLADGGTASNIGASTNAAANLVFDGGTLSYTGVSNASIDRLLTIGAGGGSVDSSGAGTLVFSNTGPVAFSGAGNRTFTLTGTTQGTLGGAGEFNTAAGAMNSFGPSLGDPAGADTLALVKSGTGVWVLPTANSYEGGTQVQAGHLAILNSTALGAATGSVSVAAGAQLALSAHGLTVANPITLNGTTNYVWSGNTLVGALVGNNRAGGGNNSLTGTLTLNATSNVSTSWDDKSVSISGQIVGAGGLQVDRYRTGNNGPLVILNRTASANTYGVGTTVNAGILSLGTGGTGADTSHVGALGTNPVTIASGAQVRLWIRNNAAFTIANDFILNGGTLHDEDGNYTMTGSFTVNSTSTLSARYTGKDLTIAGPISGAGGVTIQNVNGNSGGAVVFSNTGNNYAGTTTVTHNLRLGASNVIPNGAGTGNVTVNGNLNLNGFSDTINGLNGAGGTINTGVAGTSTLTVGDNNATASFAGLISNGSGTVAITKTGSGTQTISGTGSSTNTASGLMTVDQGTLIVGAGFAGDGAWQGNVTVNNTGTLQLAQSNIFNNGSDFTINTGGTFNMAGFSDAIGNLSGGGNITNNGGITLDDLAVNAVFSGSLTGGGGLFLRSSNTSGTQTFSGSVTAGTVAVRSNTTGTNSTLILNGATVNAVSFSIGETNNAMASGATQGHVNQTGGSVTVSQKFLIGHWPNGTSSYTLNSGSLTLTGTPGGVVNPGGVGEQNGIIYLGVDGTGTFTQSGGTVSAQGVVLDARGNTAGTDVLTLNGGTMTLGASGIKTGNLDANTSYLINLGGGTLRASANWSSAMNMVLTNAVGPAVFDTNGNNITLSGVLSGATGGLTKLGAGTLTLTGTNTYDGATNVNTGTLLVNGNSGAANGNVTLAAGAVLGGSGTIGGAVSGAGTVAPGATFSPSSTAILNVNNASGVTLTGMTFETQINGVTTAGTQYDQLNVTGPVTLGGTAILSLTGSTHVPNPVPLESVTLINNDGSDLVSGTFAGLPEGSPVPGVPSGTWYISYAGGDGNDVVLYSQPVVNGGPGADTLVLRQVSGDPTLVEFSLNGTPFVQVSSAVPFTFNGLGGTDLMLVDTSNGDPIPTGNANFIGEFLQVLGTGVESVVTTPTAVTITGFGDVNLTGTTNVDLVNLASAFVRTASGNDTLGVADTMTSDNGGTVLGGYSLTPAAALAVTGAGPAVGLRTVGTATIDTVTGGGDGNDTVTVTGGTGAHGVTNLTITTGTGTDTVTFTGSLTVAGTAAITTPGIAFNGGTLTAATATLTAGAGGITTNGPATDIVAPITTLVATGTGIGSAVNRLRIDATTLQFTANGLNAFLEDVAGGLQVTNSTVGAANTIDLLVTGGNLTSVVDGTRDLGAQTLILSVPNGTIGTSTAARLEINVVGTLTATTTPGNGDIFLRQVFSGLSSLAVANVNAGTGNVDILVSDGNLTSAAGDAGVADIVGTNVTLQLGTNGRSFGVSPANRLEVDAALLQLITTGVGANNAFVVDTAGGVQLTDSSVGGNPGATFDLLVLNGNLTSVVDGTGDARGDIVVVQTTGVGTIGTSVAAPLEVNANTRFDATTANQNAFVADVVGGFPVGTVAVGAGTADLRAPAGAITDANGASVNVTAGAAALVAATGVGTAIDPIETAVTNLAAAGGTGGVFVSNTGSLTITTVNGQVGITAAGPITVTTPQNLTVSQPVAAGGAANLLFGQGGAGNTAQIDAAVTGTTATVTGGTGADILNVTASGATTLTLNGAAGADTYNVAFGGLGGTVAIADGVAGGGDVATVTGTAGVDTIEVNTTAAGGASTVRLGATVQRVTYTPALEGMTIDGAGAADTVNVHFANGPLPATFNLFDSGGTAGDLANLFGTGGADLFDVNNTFADAVVFGTGMTAERVNYNAALESLSVNGQPDPLEVNPSVPVVPDAGDTFFVHPDQQTALAINGGNPTTGIGDTLQLSVIGMPNPVLSGVTLPDGNVTAGGWATTNWTSIETLPIPIGMGGSFDFQPAAGSPTEVGWTAVHPGTAYTGAQGYGWTKAPPRSYDGGPTGGATLSDLLRDGVDGFPGSAADAVFRLDLVSDQPVQITAFLGDAYAARDGLTVQYSFAGPGGPWTDITPLGGATIGLAQYTSLSGIADPAAPGPVYVRVWDQGGVLPNWAINGLEVRPATLVAPLALARADAVPGATPQVADGLTVDTYVGSGANPGEAVTITAQFGTFASPDARTDLAGHQVIASPGGTFSFDILRPTGSPTSAITARGFTGESSTDPLVGGVPFAQSYQLPSVRRVDFGPAGSPVAADGGGRYLGFGTTVYSADNQLGWVTAPAGTNDRGVGGALNQDTVFNWAGGMDVGARDFRVDLPGAGVYSVTVTLGDAVYVRDLMRVEVMNAAGTTVVSTPVASLATPAGQVQAVTFTVDTAAVGGTVARIRFSDLGGDTAWSVTALEVRPNTGGTTGPAPGPASVPLPFEPRQDVVVTPGVAVPNGPGPLFGTADVAVSVTGATPGALLTVGTALGTVLTADASGGYVGTQVLADGSGNASFTIRVPQATAATTSAVTAGEVTGARSGAGTANIPASPPSGGGGAGTLRFDMDNGNTLYAAASDRISVRAGTNWYWGLAGFQSAGAQFGWASPYVRELDRGGLGMGAPAPASVFGDFHYNWGAETFLVKVAANQLVDIRVDAYDPINDLYGAAIQNLSGMTIQVEGMASPRSLPQLAADAGMPFDPEGGVFVLTNAMYGGKDANGDGVLTIGFYGGPWVVNGIDVAPAGSLPATPLKAGFAAPTAGAAAVLTESELAPVVAEAVRRWSAAGADAGRLAGVTFTVADLSGSGELGGHRPGAVVVDDDGGGRGWFVDGTPGDDAEFTWTGTQWMATAGPAAGQADLLTVVMHELGHQLGYGDVVSAGAPGSVMGEDLDVGTRRVPGAMSVADTDVYLWAEEVEETAPVGPDGGFLAESAAPVVVTGSVGVGRAAGYAPVDLSRGKAGAVPAWFSDDDLTLNGIAVE